MKKEPVPHASPIYGHLVPAYQALWPRLARRRIHQAIEALDIPSGAKVLEVGVGTGMSLAAYPSDVQVTGIDLSESMLAEAVQLIADRGWSHVKVMPMNAEDLQFDDASFDYITSFHTISVVSSPRKMMAEMVRVCKPGGQITVVNHFRSRNPVIAKVVDSASGLTERLGWRTDLQLQQVIEELPLRIEARYKSSPTSLFTIIRMTRY